MRSGENPVCLARLWLQRALLSIGILLLIVFVVAHLDRILILHNEILSFERARQEQHAITPSENTPSQSAISGEVNTPAVHAPATSAIAVIKKNRTVPLAILRIPRIGLEAPVLKGTDEITLNHGIGQIAGTALPGEKGNVGLAGHRDGLFRNLKGITRGDLIELETTTSSATYVVTQILITDAEDTSVLKTSERSSLTLVTCYPFHFIGPAPRRYIVQAELKQATIE